MVTTDVQIPLYLITLRLEDDGKHVPLAITGRETITDIFDPNEWFSEIPDEMPNIAPLTPSFDATYIVHVEILRGI
ncbi:MAG: hypothetical protein ABIH34_02805 [Nanoarchaeota archaeon]